MNTLKTTALLAALTGLLVVGGAAVGGRAGAVAAFAVALAVNFASYWFSDRIVLASTRARPLGPDEAPRLHALVGRLADRAGIPRPRLFLVPSPSPNAFATGRNPAHAVVAVTQGLLELMEPDEIEGVVAHELGHVVNRDILISSVAAALAGAVTLLASLARWGALLGGGGRGRDGANPFALLAMALLAPIAALLIRMAVSRSREYGADETGARLAGGPEGLARALRKLDQASRSRPLGASPTLSHLFIVQPFSRQAFAGLFATHPPIEERVRRLLREV